MGSRDVLLAVDPGIRACGIAMFVGGTLQDADLVKSAAPVGDPTPTRCAAMAEAVLERAWGWWYVESLVVEWPQVYRAGRAKRGADPNDLLLLAGVCGALATTSKVNALAAFLPREWKGTLSKEIACARVLARLSAEERGVVDLLGLPKSSIHHVLDAVGIGLHAVGRGLR